MKKITLLFLLMIEMPQAALFAHPIMDDIMFFFNSPIGLQLGAGTREPYFRPAFDMNLTFVFVSAGVNYSGDFGSNAYFGAAYGSLAQIQYGYAFTRGKSLLRLRSDYPLYNFDSESILSFFSVGAFFEHAFGDRQKGTVFGVNIGLNLLPVLMDIM